MKDGVYADGTRAENPVANWPDKKETPVLFQDGRRRLPTTRDSITHHFEVGGMDGYITIGLYPDESPGELFITIAKEGSTVRGLMDAVGILTSLLLQRGAPLPSLCAKMRGVTFEPSGLTFREEVPHASSVIDYIFTWLDKRFNGAVVARPEVPELADRLSRSERSGSLCPDCGALTVYQEGCILCPSCGWSKC